MEKRLLPVLLTNVILTVNADSTQPLREKLGDLATYVRSLGLEVGSELVSRLSDLATLGVRSARAMLSTGSVVSLILNLILKSSSRRKPISRS